MKKRSGLYTALTTVPSKQIRLLERRLFLKHSLSLGALVLLTGCDVTDVDAVQKTLWAMSKWNDRVQGWLFNPNKLAPVYPESAITKPFPFNAFTTKTKFPWWIPSDTDWRSAG